MLMFLFTIVAAIGISTDRPDDKTFDLVLSERSSHGACEQSVSDLQPAVARYLAAVRRVYAAQLPGS